MRSLMHPVLGQVNYSTVQMPVDADSQVQQAVSQMSRYAIADSQTPEVQQDAEYAAKEAGGDVVKGAYLYARKKIRFAEDGSVILSPNVVEVLIRPVDVSVLADRLGTGCVEGDCDDFSMYVASLLLAKGVPCCFATVAADEGDPSAYSHVYVVAYPEGKRVAVDASHGKYCGWEAPNRFGKFREWDLFESANLRTSQSTALLTFIAVGALAWWYFNRYGFGGSFGSRYDD